MHADLTDRIIGAFFRVHRELGPGFAEKAYERALFRVIEDAGLHVEAQTRITVRFRGETVALFRPDLLVARAVLVEVKARPRLEAVDTAQLLNYLRATEIEVGLLLNFGTRPEFKRLVFSNERKGGRGSSNTAVRRT